MIPGSRTREPLVVLMAAAVLIKGCGGGCEIFDSWPSVPAPEGVWVVRAEAPEGGDGRNWRTAFRHPQDAVDAAEAGDEVWVAGRTYTRRADGDTVVLTMKDGVSLYGGFAGTEGAREERDWSVNVTTLDGDADGDGEGDVYHVVVGASDATFDGFTLTGGNAEGGGESADGGGMYNLHVTDLLIESCVFTGNRAAQQGGGMYNVAGGWIINCTFSDNSALSGGGVCNIACGLLITGCTFSNNVASGNGGGMCNTWASPRVKACVFQGNTAVVGGGMSTGYMSAPLVVGCIFKGNAADNGGAAHNYDEFCSPVFVNCVFSGNSATQLGGGVHNGGNTRSALTNCTFYGNSADSGGAIYNISDLPVVNCILWDDRANIDGQEVSWEYSPVDITYSCIAQNGYAGNDGNINADPLFVAPGRWDDNGTPGDPFDDFWVDHEGSDYRLQPGSPCIDAGDNSAVPPDIADLDADGDTTEPLPLDLAGAARFVDDPATSDTGAGSPPIVDMGAYEFQP